MQDLTDFYSAVAPRYDLDYEELARPWTDFFVQLAMESGGPVLEAGCGTGRIATEAARRGLQVTGVDISEAMLDQFRAKLARESDDVLRHVQVVHADFRVADLGTAFRLIISPGNVMNSFVEREDQRAWLRNVRRHLASDGSFCFDTFQPDYFRMLTEFSAGGVDIQRAGIAPGTTVRRNTRCTYDWEFQGYTVEMRWSTFDGAGMLLDEESKSIRQHWFTRPEIENLLELEGFRILDYWGNWDRTAFGRGSPEQIVRAVVG